MKDINDAQTIDWVDEVESVDTCYAPHNKPVMEFHNTETLLIAPPVNPAWHAVIAKLVEQTINDIENQQEQ